MIRRVGVSGLTLLLASSALALGVLTIGGPYSADVEWLSNQASFSPVVLEKPDVRLPAVKAGKTVAPAGIGLARPAAIRINPPAAADADLDDARIRPVAIDAPEPALGEVAPTSAGALAAVTAVAIQPPDTRPLELTLETGFVAIELESVEVQLAPVKAPAPKGLLCFEDCVADPDLRTCDKIGGTT